MTRLSPKPDADAPVRPSSPDAVEAWLDVLVSLLPLAKEERQTVRDELEDHLRSRVDDLLITGLTEPEALQKAVAELGETADLARQISHAHRTPNPRRTAMHAALIALSGSVVALSVALFRPATTALPESVVAATATTETAPESDADPSLIDPREARFSDVCDGIRRIGAAPVLVHWDVLKEIGIEPDTPVALDADPLPAWTAFELMAESTAMATGAKLTFDDSLGMIEIATQDLFDQRSMQRKMYNIADLLEGSPITPVSTTRSQLTSERTLSVSGSTSFLDTVMAHVSPEAWTRNGGDLAVASIVDEVLIVTAPSRIQREVAGMLGDLFAQSQGRRASEEKEQAAARAEAQVRYAARVNAITAEYDSAKQAYLEKSAALEMLESEVDHLVRAPETDQQVRARLTELAAAKPGMELEAREAKQRLEYLQSRMLDVQYLPLFTGSDLDLPVSAPTTPGAVTVRGAGLREGTYDLDPGMTLSRMLRNANAAAIGSEDAVVTLIRGGAQVGEWGLSVLRTTPAGDTRLARGDEIMVTR